MAVAARCRFYHAIWPWLFVAACALGFLNPIVVFSRYSTADLTPLAERPIALFGASRSSCLVSAIRIEGLLTLPGA